MKRIYTYVFFISIFLCGALDGQAQTAPTSFVAGTATTSSVQFTWSGTATTDFIIVRSTTSTVSDLVDGTTYAVNDVLANGTVVAITAPGNTFTDVSLTANTQYWYKIFDYKSSGTKYSTGLAGTMSTLAFATEPTAQPSSLTFSNYLANGQGFTLSYTAATGTPAGYIVLIKSGAAAPTSTPVDGTTYTAGNTFGDATVAFVDATPSLTFNQTGLTASNQYSYAVYSYNGSGSQINYYLTSPLTGSATTLAAEPTAQPTSLVFSAKLQTGLGYTVSYTAASGTPSGYLVLRKAGSSAPTSTPADGTTYTAGNTFGDATVAFVDAAAALTFNETALSTSSQYSYAVYAYNGTGVSTNYYLTSPLTGSATTLAAEPTTQPTSLVFSSYLATGLGYTVAYTAASGAPSGYIVLRKSGAAAPTSTPVDGTTYTAGNTFGDATVAFVDAAAALTFNETALSTSSQYSYAVYSYNGSGSSINYYLTTPLTGSATTLAAEPTAQPTSLIFSAKLQTGLGYTVAYTAATGTPAGYIVLRKSGGSAPVSTPVDGTTYTAGNTFGDATVAFVDAAAALTFNETALSASTQYSYAVYSYNGSGVSINYYLTSPLTGSATTLAAQPSSQSTAMVFSSVTNTSLTVSWTVPGAGGGNNRILVVKQGGSPTAPTDGTTYTANSVFGSVTAGEITAAGSDVIYIGNSNTANITGLTANTSYTFNLYEFNTSVGGDENYLTTSPLSGTQKTTDEPSNYPTAFTATATATTITLNWTAAAAGSVAPSNYLIVARDVTNSGAYPAFSDGVAVPANDANLSSQTSTWNGVESIAFGTNTYNGWTNLTAGNKYEFTIYSYTTAGAPTPDYKTSPAAPVVTVYTEPSASSALTLSNITTTTIDVNLTSVPSATGGYLVVRKLGSTPTTLPTDGTTYTVGGTIAAGETVVWTGTSGTPAFTDTGLTPLSNYFYKVYTYSGSGSNVNYRTTSPGSANATTLCSPPTTQVSNVTFGTTNAGSMVINWTPGDGTGGTIILMRNGSAVGGAGVPSSGTTYLDGGNVFLSGDSFTEPGNDDWVVYVGSGNTATITGLSGSTTYYVSLMTYNSTGTCYLTTSPATGNKTTPSADVNSTLTGGTGAVSIPTTVVTQGAETAVFTFTIGDQGTSDGVSTRFTQLIFRPGTGNFVTDWAAVIAGAELWDNESTPKGGNYSGSGPRTGTHDPAIIASNSITIPNISAGNPPDLGSITDGTSRTYYLKIWFKTGFSGSVIQPTLPTTIDNQNLVFSLTNTGSDITPVAGYSQIAPSLTQNSGSSNDKVTVTASLLTFTTDPAAAAYATVPLSTEPILKATDAYGNYDLDNIAASVSTPDAALGAASAPTQFTSGIMDFTGSGFKYNNIGTSRLTVTTTSPSLNVTSTTSTVVTASTDLGSSTTSMSVSPLQNSSVGSISGGVATNAVLGFKLVTTGSTLTLTDLMFTASGTNPSVDVSNFKLYTNTSDSFTGATLAASSASLTFSGMSITINGTPTYFFLVCDVAAYFNNSSPTVQFQLPAGNFTTSPASGQTGSTQTGTNYSLKDATPPTLNKITVDQSILNSWATTVNGTTRTIGTGTASDFWSYTFHFSEPISGMDPTFKDLNGTKNPQSVNPLFPSYPVISDPSSSSLVAQNGTSIDSVWIGSANYTGGTGTFEVDFYPGNPGNGTTYYNGTGQIKTNGTSNIQSVSGTNFPAEIAINDIIYANNGAYIGTVNGGISSSQFSLYSPTSNTIGSGYSGSFTYAHSSLIFGPGSINANTFSNTISGTSTSFTTQVVQNDVILDGSYRYIGTVQQVVDDFTILLYNTPQTSFSSSSYYIDHPTTLYYNSQIVDRAGNSISTTFLAGPKYTFSMPQPTNPVVEFDVVSNTTTSATLQWKNPGGAQEATSYLIVAVPEGSSFGTVQDSAYRKTNGTTLVQNVKKTSAAGQYQTFTFGSLNPATNYDFVIYPYTLSPLDSIADNSGFGSIYRNRTIDYNTTAPNTSTSTNSAYVSAASDIIHDSGFIYTNTGIDYISYSKNAAAISASTDGYQVEQFLLRDGGVTGNDNDKKNTILNTLQLSFTGSTNVNDIQTVFITNKSTNAILGKLDYATNVSGGVLTFNSVNLTASDDDNTNTKIGVYVTFNQTSGVVQDHDVINVRLFSASVSSSGSSFFKTNGNAVASTSFVKSTSSFSNNSIDVIATKLVFATQTAANLTASLNTAYTHIQVSADDANNNVDIDYNATNTKVVKTFTNNGSPTVNMSIDPTGKSFTAGVLDWAVVANGLTNFQFTSGNNGETFTLTMTSTSTSKTGVTDLTGTSQSITLSVATDSYVYFDPTFTGTTFNNFVSQQQTTMPASNPNSDPTIATMAQLILSDGGAANFAANGTHTPGDIDGAGTTITGISFSVTGAGVGDIRTLALYDETTGQRLGAQQSISSNSVSFSGFTLTATTNSTANFSIRGSFNQTVIDQDQFTFKVTGVTWSAGSQIYNYNSNTGPYFGGVNGGSASLANTIDVIATSIDFVDGNNGNVVSQPSAFAGVSEPIGKDPATSQPYSYGNPPNFTAMPTTTAGIVTFRDKYGNIDKGFGSNVGYVSVTDYAGNPINTSTLGSPVNGVISLDGMQYPSTGDGTIKIILGNVGAGTISTSGATVTGIGTNFTSEVYVGAVLADASGTPFGTVQSVTSSTSLTLTSNSTAALTNASYQVRLNSFSPAINTTGTIAVGSGSTSVTGTGTLFTKDLKVGSRINDSNGNFVGNVASITNDLSLTLASGASIAVVSGSRYNVNSVPCTHVDVINTSVSYDTNNGVLTGSGATHSQQLKGGTLNNLIFGMRFAAPYTVGAEPKLKKFIISFKTVSTDAGGRNWFEYTGTTPVKVFTNFRVYINGVSTLVTSTGGTVVTGSSGAIGPNYLDQVTVTLGTPVSITPAGITFYLAVDVDPSAGTGTQQLIPYFVDAGYVASGTSTDANSIVSSGTCTGISNTTPPITGEFDGATFNFASTQTPVLLADIIQYPGTHTSPYNGQPNVDPAISKIQLQFSSDVAALDSLALTNGDQFVGELWSDTKNQKVADLKLNTTDLLVPSTSTCMEGHVNGTTVNTNTYLIYDIIKLPAFVAPLTPNEVYYVKIKQGSYDPITKEKHGISDFGLNFFGGVSDNSTLYFKISNDQPINLNTAVSTYDSKVVGTLTTNFDQLGKAYYTALNEFVYSTGTGTISVTANTNTVNGTGTLFTTELAVGSRLRDPSGKLYGTITAINSDVSLTLDRNFASSTDLVGSNFQFERLATGTISSTKGSSTVTGTLTSFGTDIKVGSILRTALDKPATGTISSTLNSKTITGTGTLFTTEYSVGSLVRTATAQVASGYIYTNTGSTAVYGYYDYVTNTNTLFTTEFTVGSVLMDQNGAVLGTVASITNDTYLTLTSSASGYYYGKATIPVGTVLGTVASISSNTSLNLTSNVLPGIGGAYNGSTLIRSGVVLGTVSSIVSPTSLTLTTGSTANYSGVASYPADAPTITELKTSSYSGNGLVGAQGNYNITSVNADQTATFVAIFEAETDYDVYIYAENDAQPTPVPSPKIYSFPGLITNILNSQVTNTPTANTNIQVCPDSYVTLTNPLIVCETSDPAFFSGGQQTCNILLPNGFEFDVKQKPTVDLVGSDWNQNWTYSYTNSMLTINFFNSGNSSFDYMAISGLRITGKAGSVSGDIQWFYGNNVFTAKTQRYFYPNYAINVTAGDVYTISGQNFVVNQTVTGGYYVPTDGNSIPPGSGTLTRVSGSGDASIIYNSTYAYTYLPGAPAFPLAKISLHALDTIANFTNSYWYENDSVPGQSPFPAVNVNSAYKAAATKALRRTVNAIPDNYVDTDPVVSKANSISLLPMRNPYSSDANNTFAQGDFKANIYSGNGVTGSYLNLNAVTKNAPFNITVSHTDLNGCFTTQSQQYVVYDHNNPISKKLGQTLNVTTPLSQAGTVQELVNNNFSVSGSVPLAPDSINNQTLLYNEKAGYSLIQLNADLPASELLANYNGVYSNQIITGAAWRPVVQSVLFKRDSVGPNSDFGQYRLDYSPILAYQPNGANVYDYFKKPSRPSLPSNTVSNNSYWDGGSLGKIEFTGTYQSTADINFYNAFRQNVELFLPAVPIIEMPGAQNYDSNDLAAINSLPNNNANQYPNGYPGYTITDPVTNVSSIVTGTPIYCEYGGTITLQAFPTPSGGISVGNFMLYDFSKTGLNATSGTGSIYAVDSASVWGSNTKFKTVDKIQNNAILYDANTGAQIGVVQSIKDDTHLTLYSRPKNITSATAFKFLNPLADNNSVTAGFTDVQNGTMTIDPTKLNNAYNDILVAYAFKPNASPAWGIGYSVVRVTPNPIPAFTTASIQAVSNSASGPASIDKYCEGTIINFSASPSTIGGAVSNPSSTKFFIQNYDWNFGDGNSGQTHLNGTTGTPLVVNDYQPMPAISIWPGVGYADGSYTSLPTTNLAGTAGSGAVVDIVVKNGSVTSVKLVNLGTGYVSTDSLTAALPSPSGATVLGKGFKFLYGPIQTYDAPSHYYASYSKYDVSLNLTSNWGCKSLAIPLNQNLVAPVTNNPVLYTKQPSYIPNTIGGYAAQITVGAIPTVDFSFTGNCSGVPVQFTDLSTIASGNTSKFDWYFNWNNSVTLPDSTGSGKNPTWAYLTSGIYTAQLTTTSNLGCQAASQKLLGQLTTTPASIIDFDLNDAGFLPIDISASGPSQKLLKDGQVDGAYTGKASWQWTSGTKNWATTANGGTFYDNEFSALYLSCLNVQIPRPMISFDASIDLENGGLVLQYSSDSLNILDPAKKWYTLGADGSGNLIPGIDWYNNINALSPVPGQFTYNSKAVAFNQKALGWTGLSQVLQPKHALDSPNGDLTTKVQPLQLRLAFATTSSSGLAGVTIDNIRFGTRTRTVLFENFTSTNAGTDVTVNQHIKDDAVAISNFVQNNINNTQLVNINYHVGFLGSDPFNVANPADPSSRVLYYGVKEVPYAFLDGIHNPLNNSSDLFKDWGQAAYDLQTLKLAKADFGLNTLRGTISTNTSSSAVIGVGTKFLTDLIVGLTIRDGMGAVIGTVASIIDDLNLTLTSNASINVSGGLFTTTGLKQLAGTITATTSSATVSGAGTKFLTQLSVNDVIRDATGAIIGTVASIGNDTNLTLFSSAAINVSGGVYQIINTVTPTTVQTDLTTGSFEVDVNVTPKVANLPTTTRLQVLVLEDTVMVPNVNIPSSWVTTGEDHFEYVLRKMLPDAVGTDFPAKTFGLDTAVHLGPNREVNGSTKFKWTIDKKFDNKKFTVVLFLQDEITKEVYQAELYRNIPYPTATVTVIEPTAENLKVYPNPADQELTIVLPSPAKGEMSISMVNQLGVLTDFGSFAEGERTKTIKTGGLSAGVYILQMGSNNNAIRTKVIVLH